MLSSRCWHQSSEEANDTRHSLYSGHMERSDDPSNNMKLAVAFGMFNECFNLVKDQCTKINMFHQAMYILDLNLNG